MILRTRLYESEDDGKKMIRGRDFELTIDGPFYWPSGISVRIYREPTLVNDPTGRFGPVEDAYGTEALYEKREEWLNKRPYRTYYVRVS